MRFKLLFLAGALLLGTSAALPFPSPIIDSPAATLGAAHGASSPAPWSGFIHIETVGSGSGVYDSYGNTDTWSEHDYADIELSNGRAYVSGAINFSDADTKVDICHPPSLATERVDAVETGKERFSIDPPFVTIGVPLAHGTAYLKNVCEGETTLDKQMPAEEYIPGLGYSDAGGFVLPHGPNSGGTYKGKISRSEPSPNAGDNGPTCYAPSAAVGKCTITISWFFYKRKMSIKKVSLLDIDSKPLSYLSVAADYHTNQGTIFHSNTRVNGTLKIHGPKNYVLDKVQLLVTEHGGVTTAVGHLAPAAAAKLLGKPFGPDETLAITTPQLLFEIPSSEAGKLILTIDNKLDLSVHIQATNEQEDWKAWGSVRRLTRYTSSNRYGPRDLGVGGDDWIRPSIKLILDQFAPGHCYGDMSNMNGGIFDPHETHQDGIDVDVNFDSPDGCGPSDSDGSFSNTSAADAQRVINDLNSPLGSQIARVYVTFHYSSSDHFWNAIKNVMLADGRRACRVIRSVPLHIHHFHWRFVSEHHPGKCPGDPGVP